MLNRFILLFGLVEGYWIVWLAAATSITHISNIYYFDD